jgi:nicotinate-nucleotide adenylyltransferase
LRIGIMGGTFDPIHVGHLRAAENAREALALDRVEFVPAHVPPHRAGPLSSPLDRYAMVCLATSAHPSFVASDRELRRDGPSYTVDTVRSVLEETPGAEVVLIVGSDTFPEMASWKDPQELFSLCSVAVVDRPEDGAPRAEGPAADREVTLVRGPGLAVSATTVRQRVREGRSVRYLVPPAVEEYITKKGLYR